MRGIRNREFPVALLLLEISASGKGAVYQTGDLGETSIAFALVTFWVASPTRQKRDKKNVSNRKKEIKKMKV